MQDQRAWKAKQILVSVRVLWRMGYHYLNSSLLTKLCVVSLSTKETSSPRQRSPCRLEESFLNLKMKNSIIIRTATSLEVWCSLPPGQDQIFFMPYPCFHNSFQIQLEDTETWLKEWSNTWKLLKNPFFSWALSKEGPRVSHQYLRLRETENRSPSLTVILLLIEKQEKADLEFALASVTRWSIGNQENKNHASKGTSEAEFYALLEET